MVGGHRHFWHFLALEDGTVLRDRCDRGAYVIGGSTKPPKHSHLFRLWVLATVRGPRSAPWLRMAHVWWAALIRRRLTVNIRRLRCRKTWQAWSIGDDYNYERNKLESKSSKRGSFGFSWFCSNAAKCCCFVCFACEYQTWLKTNKHKET